MKKFQEPLKSPYKYLLSIQDPILSEYFQLWPPACSDQLGEPEEGIDLVHQRGKQVEGYHFRHYALETEGSVLREYGAARFPKRC